MPFVIQPLSDWPRAQHAKLAVTASQSPQIMSLLHYPSKGKNYSTLSSTHKVNYSQIGLLFDVAVKAVLLCEDVVDG